jgi:riboflavin biosynthesis pyrimidine reductase
MAVIATLVVGANNATTIGGSSVGLSTPPDRRRFLDLHRSASAIITGKTSAKKEDYSKTEVPIFIFSRDRTKLTLSHPQMEQIAIDNNLTEITRELGSRFEGEIVIEAGPELLHALVDAGAVDYLQLSIVPIEGDGNYLDLQLLMRDFSIESEEDIDGTRLLKCRYNRDATNS